jgi:hypothetical protein
MTSVSTAMSRLILGSNDKLVHEYLKQDIFIFKTYSFKTKFAFLRILFRIKTVNSGLYPSLLQNPLA